MSADLLRRDADFPPFENATAGPLRSPPRAILLTGATGFLGSRVLREILDRTEARVYCLARERQPVPSPRVIPVPGDFDRFRLGLDPNTWRRLAGEVDAVYHCGARVHLTLPYAALRRTNVLGTREVLRFLSEGRRKRFHYASTLSVFVATDRNTGVMREADRLDSTRWVYGGYAQSKWAAEVMARRAPRFSCYRFGLLTGDSRTGEGPANDLFSMFVRGGIDTGAGDDLEVDVTPVDYAAAAMVHLSLHAGPGTYHIANPRSLALGDLRRAIGGRRADPASGAAARLALCRARPGYDRLRALDLFQATGARFAMENTRRGLRGSGLSCPPPEARLLRLYLRRLEPGS
jgi:thioester reductase-like protein